MKLGNIIISLVVVIALVACGALATISGVYNGLVSKSERVDGNWAQVENQMKRRNDLVQNLVNSVKGYVKHEDKAFGDVSAAHAAMSGAKTPMDAAKANIELTSALNRLMVLVENYPNLKADAQFTALMAELAGTENRLAVARMDYNNSVKEFNVSVKTFPTNIIAGMFGFGPREFFEVSDAEKAVPTVDFSN